jgi:hypothetical protein
MATINVTPTIPATASPAIESGSIPGIDKVLDNGWWLAIGCGVAIVITFTPLAPLGLGIVGIATLFQLEKMFKGTNPTAKKGTLV